MLRIITSFILRQKVSCLGLVVQVVNSCVVKWKAGSHENQWRALRVRGVWIFLETNRNHSCHNFLLERLDKEHRGGPHHPVVEGVCSSTTFLGKFPGRKGRECPPGNGYPHVSRTCDDGFLQEHCVLASCGGHSKVMLDYSTGIMSILLLWKLLFVCMILPGGGSRLQTLGRLAA